MKYLKEKIYKKDNFFAYNDILEFYKKNKFGIINYLYFGNLVINNILKGPNDSNRYYNSLINGNFLLPDGIALKIFFKSKYNISLKNLNGTDFIDFFLNNLILNFGNKNINLILYGTYDYIIPIANKYILEKYGIKSIYFQDGYKKFDFDKIKNIENIDTEKQLNLFLVGRGTPLQETWIFENIEQIKKYKLLTFAQGGTFDFWGGFETRAPYIFRKINIEWLRRCISKPKKNLNKFLNSLMLFYYLLKK